MKKNRGILEYQSEKYIFDIIDRIKPKLNANISFLSLKDHDFSDFKRYDLIYDMISPFNKYVAEIMKIYYLNGTYIINNPFVVTTYNKIIQTHKLIEMNMPIPKTLILPDEPDSSESDFFTKPLFEEIAKKFKFPLIMKPYDGFANIGVNVVNSIEEMQNIQDRNKDKIMLLQEAIKPIDFYRVFIINKKHVYFLKRKPRFIEAEKYDFYDHSKLNPVLRKYIEQRSIEITKKIGYDLSTIEWSITEDNKAFIIDINDAPNIPDAEKAKKDDLFFPDKAYQFVIDNISKMIIDKVKADRNIGFKIGNDKATIRTILNRLNQDMFKKV